MGEAGDAESPSFQSRPGILASCRPLSDLLPSPSLNYMESERRATATGRESSYLLMHGIGLHEATTEARTAVGATSALEEQWISMECCCDPNGSKDS